MALCLAASFTFCSATTLAKDGSKRDGETARYIAILQSRAEAGEAEAQYWLGLRYATGDGVARDEARRMLLWRKAADQGHLEATYFYGLAHSIEGSPYLDLRVAE